MLKSSLPSEIRQLCRDKKLDTPTSGLAPGYVQANLVVLPYSLAFDFLLFCQRNPKPSNAAPQLNSDNFQGSFGRQVFLYPPNQEIVQCQIEGKKFYQQGLYYQSFTCFFSSLE